MKNKKGSQSSKVENIGRELRSRAEKLVDQKRTPRPVQEPADSPSMLHELQVHQIELELQNQELQQAHLEAELARHKYFVLYDLAPVGYATFGPKGEILEINLTGARLLGEERRRLVNRRFQLFVMPGDIPFFNDFMERVSSTGTKQVCEVTLIKDGDRLAMVRIEGVRAEPNEGTKPLCQAALLDITEQKQAKEAIKAARDELEVRVQERTIELEKANEHLANQSRILESFFKDTITPLVLLDRDFNFIRVNEAYARATQRAVADFPGHNHFEFFPHEETEAIFRRVVENGIPYQALGTPFSFPDHPEWGVTYWDWILTPLPDDRGETAFLVFSLEEVTDRQVAEEALRKSERRLRTLADQLLYAQENERKKIARDMHDSLGASLSALKYKLEDLIHNLPDRDPRQIRETLVSLIPIIQETIGEALRMQNDLRPPHLDDLGILPTLSWLSRKFQKIYSRIAVEQRLEVRDEDVPELLKVVIFRITQEAFNNIAKHARATRIKLYLGREQNKLKLVIRDNGAGFNLKGPSKPAGRLPGMGLSIMKERADLSGGSFSVESHPGKGTIIEVSWPWDRKMGVENQED